MTTIKASVQEGILAVVKGPEDTLRIPSKSFMRHTLLCNDLVLHFSLTPAGPSGGDGGDRVASWNIQGPHHFRGYRTFVPVGWASAAQCHRDGITTVSHTGLQVCEPGFNEAGPGTSTCQHVCNTTLLCVTLHYILCVIAYRL